VRRASAASFLVLAPLLAGAQPARSPSGEKVIDVRAARPPAGNTFEALFNAYRKAEQRGDTDGALKAWREIRRARIERNIRSLETLALATVAHGLERLEKGERDRAEEDFRGATSLDPHLPDAYFAMALSEMKKVPLGIVPAISDTVSGLTARLPAIRGRLNLRMLLLPVLLLSVLVTATVFAAVMVISHGTLLLHDLEEAFGAERRALAVGLFVLALALPVAAFQGYGWLPLWWLALLFLYMQRGERLAAAAILAGSLAAGPVIKDLEARILTQQNPLFRAGVLSMEAGPDARAIADLEDAMGKNRDDHDLAYLLALQYKKMGRYDDAAALYREILQVDPRDAIALNNLANLEFANAEYQAAIARYKQGIESGPPAPVAATFYYNLSLAHLQRFEYQPAQEARSQADRLAGSLTRTYDSLWKYDKGDYAVVDMGLEEDDLWTKFAGTPSGIRQKNVAGRGTGMPRSALVSAAVLNRFVGAIGVFVLVGLVFWRWRGSRAFTVRCVKCGTPFCKHCHLGKTAVGLCTQCHHLFIVRDGVSGPARNRKLLEVQKEEERRDWIFRLLSLISPGAGHLYAQKTALGLALVFGWSLLLVLALLAGRVLPYTEAPSAIEKPWGLGLMALVLVAVYVVANRARPEVDIMLPARRSPPPARPGRAA
jgi:tetratricopeptide (TPR) repeat protein